MDFEHSTPAKTSPRKKYTTHFLRSFAGTDSCRRPPPSIDLREINSEVSVEEDVPEWRRRASTPSPTGKNGSSRRRNRLSHSLSASSRSQGKEHNLEEHVSTFPTKNRVAKNSGDASVKLEKHPLEPKGSKHYNPRLKLTPLEVVKVDNEIKKGNLLNASPGASDSEASTELSDQRIDLGTLFVMEKSPVLPMPTAPTLEEIEKDMKVAEKQSFLTCQDVEKSILTVTEDDSISPGSGGREQWPDGEDKVASKHILSLLQRKPSNKEDLAEEKRETCKNKDLFGELILSNLEEVMNIANSDSKRDASFRKSRLMYSDTIDSMRTTVKQSTEDNLVAPGKGESFSPAATSIWQTMPPLQKQQQHWQMKLPPPLGGLLRPPSISYANPPNTFLQTRPVAAGMMGETPLVPQALQALQRLVDHQLHILNTIPGEVTPGMLHQRLSRSVLGYPATGTHLLLATSGAPAYRFA